MKCDEMELIAPLLLESRTGAYIEWLDNKLNMAANNNINKDSQLALLSAKRKPANHKAESRGLGNTNPPSERKGSARVVQKAG